MNKNRNVLRAALVVVLLVALAFWFLGNPLSSEITVYPLYCGKDTGKEGRCINLMPITYRVFPDMQKVAYWTDTGVPATLADCTVRDRWNWECWYKDRRGRLWMADGTFRQEVLKDIPGKDTFDSVRYVPKWKWWAARIGIATDG